MFGVDVNVTPAGYTLWQHETGYDESDGVTDNAILSYFETAEVTMLNAEENARSKTLRVERVEPDFVQFGSMNMYVRGRSNARAPQLTSAMQTITETASAPDEETNKMLEAYRLMSFKFESNVSGGYYEAGEIYAHVGENDGRVES